MTAYTDVRTNRVLQEIQRYKAMHEMSPTIREIQALADISSTSVALYHLRKLEKQGRIRRPAGKPRSIQLCDSSPTTLTPVEWQAVSYIEELRRDQRPLQNNPDRVSVSRELLELAIQWAERVGA